jgi:hypothetical protein
MRFVDPVRGLVVETTGPRTANILKYGLGYWSLDGNERTDPESATQQGIAPAERDPDPPGGSDDTGGVDAGPPVEADPSPEEYGADGGDHLQA